MADGWQRNVENPPDLSWLNQLFTQQAAPQNSWATEPMRRPGQLREAFAEDPAVAKQQAGRTVILSRYAKVNRIVPDSEVADYISNLLQGENISIPEKVITPSLKAELVKRGVPIEPMQGKKAPAMIDTEQFGRVPQKEIDAMTVNQLMADLAARKKGGR